MRRTQLYLHEDMWQALHAKAAVSGVTISELVRQAVQKQFIEKPSRKDALMGIVGMWRDREDMNDPEAYIRNLRKDTRLERIYGDADPG